MVACEQREKYWVLDYKNNSSRNVIQYAQGINSSYAGYVQISLSCSVLSKHEYHIYLGIL